MQLHTIHSHFGGFEYLVSHRENEINEITTAIGFVGSSVIEQLQRFNWQPLVSTGDFAACAKNGVAVQTSVSKQLARVPFWLLQQSLFSTYAIDVGVTVLPVRAIAAREGALSFEDAVDALKGHSRIAVPVPLALFGFGG